MSISINELESKARELMENIKNVDSDIKKVTGFDYVSTSLKHRKRTFDHKKPNNQASSDEKKITPVKFESTGSTAQTPLVASKVSTKITAATAADVVQEATPSATTKPVTHQEKSRSIRLFGDLMKTLTDFRIQSESDMRQNHLRDQIVENAIKIEHENDQKLKEERQSLIKLRNNKQKELSRIKQQIHMKELQNKWTKQVDQLKNFIQTKTEPKLFYMPAKFDDKTKQLLKETQQTLDKQLNERIEQLELNYKQFNESSNETHDNDHDDTTSAKDSSLLESEQKSSVEDVEKPTTNTNAASSN